MVGRTRRPSAQTRRLLRAMLVEPAREFHGYELMQMSDLPSGTVYPILDRLERRGWLESRTEDVSPTAVGRPARRLYRLSRQGSAEARAELARAEQPAPGTAGWESA